MFEQALQLDLNLLVLLNQDGRALVLDALMPVLSSAWVSPLCVTAAALWAARKFGARQLVCGLLILAAMGLTDFGTNRLKKAVNRVRPADAVAGTYYHEDASWHRLAPDFVQTRERGSSCPSAHAANSMVFAALALLFWRGLRAWPLLVPFLVGWSRVYVGKHYPLDVAAGWLFGLLVAGLVWVVWRKVLGRWVGLEGQG